MPSTQARRVGQVSGPVGYLTWFSVPSLDGSYDQLKDMAQVVGLPEDYTPSPPTARDAWRKGTHTGKRGIKVPLKELNQRLVRDAMKNRQGEPRAFLRMVEVSRAAPLLVRHLVLFVVIPGANSKNEQLEVGTVAVFEFDTETERARSLVYAYEQEWLTESYIQDVVRDRMDIMRHYMDRADNNKVRASIRDMLDDLHRTCLKNTGGVYFVPVRSKIYDKRGQVVLTAKDALDAMKSWTRALEPYAEDAPPVFRSVKLEGDNAQELRDDIVGAAIAQFKADLQAIGNSLEPVMERRALGRTAERITENAIAEFGRLGQAAKAYRESLGEQLGELDAMFRMAESALRKVQQASPDDESEEINADDVMVLLE